MRKKLYRSHDERMIAGVCGGIANYLDVDPTLARLAAVLLLFAGVGVPTYVVAWIITPLEPGAQRVETGETIESR